MPLIKYDFARKLVLKIKNVKKNEISLLYQSVISINLRDLASKFYKIKLYF